jgi:hypothetical protein
VGWQLIEDVHFALRSTGEGREAPVMLTMMMTLNIMGMMMMQQQSEQSSREANRMAREAELALRREEITLHCKEITSQLQIQRKESRAHQQMMNVMLMVMMQNIGGTNQQQRMDIGGTNQQQRMDLGGINQQQRDDTATSANDN